MIRIKARLMRHNILVKYLFFISGQIQTFRVSSIRYYETVHYEIVRVKSALIMLASFKTKLNLKGAVIKRMTCDQFPIFYLYRSNCSAEHYVIIKGNATKSER